MGTCLTKRTCPDNRIQRGRQETDERLRRAYKVAALSRIYANFVKVVLLGSIDQCTYSKDTIQLSTLFTLTESLSLLSMLSKALFRGKHHAL